MAKPPDKELLELGQKLQNFYDMGYVNKRSTLWFSFWKGLVGGFGAFIGGTIVVAILLWALSFTDNIPFISHITRTVQHTLNQPQDK